MLDLFFWILVLGISLVALIKGADWFTEGAESVGLRFGIPHFVIGVTIVSIGTSLPELASSIAAVLEGKTEIVIANVIGSNISNVLFVLGLGAALAGIYTTRNIKKIDVPVMFATTGLLLLAIWDGTFSRLEALLFLGIMVAYLYQEFAHKERLKVENTMKGARAIYALAGGILLVIVSAKFLIDSVVAISELVGISTAIISATVVAFGTSVPEAVVTVVAALKGKKEIALGNIIGSNVFNVLLVTSVAGLIHPLVVPGIMISFGIPALIITTFLLWILMRDNNLTKMDGMLLLTAYCGYIIYLFS